MKRTSAIARFDTGRLRVVLVLFFLALAIPTAVLVYQAYGQLRWETFEQHRRMADELSQRVDSLVDMVIEQEEIRSAADYQFLVLAGDPAAGFLQRSPLSGYPVVSEIPGLIGYFEVDAGGRLTTPLVPPDGTDGAAYGVSPQEYRERLATQRAIETVLVDNRLVRARDAATAPMASADPLADMATLPDTYATLRGETHRRTRTNMVTEQSLASALEEEETARADEPPPAETATFGHQMRVPGDRPPQERIAATGDAADDKQDRTAYLGRLEDLALDATLEQKSLGKEHRRGVASQAPSPIAAKRERRKEQITLPQAASAVRSKEPADSAREQPQVDDLAESAARQIGVADRAALRRAKEPRESTPPSRHADVETPPVAAALEAGSTDTLSGAGAPLVSPATEVDAGGAADATGAAIAGRPNNEPPGSSAGGLRIMTFESEIDPFEFSLLDSGHFVMFRRVWRDGQRSIQGALIEQRPFLEGLFEQAFRATALSRTGDLVIAFGDDVFAVFRGGDGAGYASRAANVSGALLHRSRLPAPLDGLEMVFSLNELPTGPGGKLIRWASLILAAVLLGGFYLLYRLGAGQIALARQQQDFVSAVSHELKTPLTSIRMYGEMLKSGWADEEKKRSYYDYIHDESERLSRLIDNVLQLARLTRSDPSFDLQPVPVSELLDTTRAKIGDHVQHAGFELEIRADDETRQRIVRVDTDCFVQIVINLVDNALKFAAHAERKLVRLSATAGPDAMVSFTVRDFGPGIPRDQRRRIFRLFYRSENELTRDTVGTGIGLALVHQLTVAMHGVIDVRNREPGAEFRVSLPVAAAS